MPSPVQIRPLVVGFQIWPAPPEARIVDFALKTSILPVRMSRAMQPPQEPSSFWMSEVVNHSS